MAERYTFGSFDWGIGENVGNVRYFDNPHNGYYYGIPNHTTYVSNPSPSKWGENMGVWWVTSQYSYPQNPMPANDEDLTTHKNSGVLRHWFYLLAHGDTYNGITVPAIGIDKAEKIAYNTFNWYLTSTSHYIDCANGSSAAAKDLFGNCSDEYKAVRKAWRAVTGNFPLANCPIIIIDGTQVINISKLASQSVEYSAQVDLDNYNVQNLTWVVPNGWQVSINGDKLKLVSTNDTRTQKLIVRYNDNGTIYESSIFVHFSNEEVIGDNQLPSNKIISESDLTAEENMIIYPNPTNNQLNIELPSYVENASYDLIDLNGRVLLSGNIFHQFAILNTQTISDGIYILHVKSSNYSQNKKISIFH